MKATNDLSRIAVVILNWNGEKMMQQFLPSVVQNSGNARIIVADNGSTDGSLSLLKAQFPTVELITLAQNYGFAEGYNRALAQVEAVDYFLLLNSDVEVPPHWLDSLYVYMEAHKEVAACQPKIMAQQHPSMFEYAGAAGGYIDAYGYPFCRGRIMSTVEVDEGQYDEVATIFWGSGAALMVRVEDWKAVGGFDGRFFAHMEEIDFCWRLRASGRKLVCVPSSRVFHVGGGTLNAGSPRKTYLNFRNNLLMLYKNLPEQRLRKVMWVRSLLDGVAATKMLFTDGWGHAAAVCKARRDFHRMKKDFAADRAQNMSRMQVNPIPEEMKGGLLYQYYVKGKKKFSQLSPQCFE